MLQFLNVNCSKLDNIFELVYKHEEPVSIFSLIMLVTMNFIQILVLFFFKPVNISSSLNTRTPKNFHN